MHDEQENHQPKADEELGSMAGTVVKSSLILALVAGLTSVIYLVARDQPKEFPVVIPMESQPEPPADEPVKTAPNLVSKP